MAHERAHILKNGRHYNENIFYGIDYNKTIFKWHPLKSKHFFMAEIKMRSFLNGIDYRESRM